MIRRWAESREIAAVERGQIIQRVLVDGWSNAQAAATFGIAERQVARWVAAYRRRGMESLRDASGAAPAPRRLGRRLRVILRRLLAAIPGTAGNLYSAACVQLPVRRSGNRRR